MSNEFDDRLRDALRPVDPGAAFTERVLSRIDREPRKAPRPSNSRMYWIPATLAASLLLTVAGIHRWQMQREQQGLEARRQLIEALHLTGEKLDLAYQAVNDASQSSAGDDTGA